jgi:hypothetical protein
MGKEDLALPFFLILSHLFCQILELQMTAQALDNNGFLSFERYGMNIWFKCTLLKFLHLFLHPELLEALRFFL